MQYAHTDEAAAEVGVSPDELFAHLDDQARLGAHMEKPSMMMMGGRMIYELDEAKGRAVGSVIKMGGSFLGLRLFVEEAVTERDPPRRKVWETRGRPSILIIGSYRMGFEIEPSGERSKLRVFIEYDDPPSLVGRILGGLFAPVYARWCVKRMAEDARRHFA
jgi:Polyketide cyclase / dehydrase and lipid transport